MMVAKRDINRLLKKGLTGLEAARLILQDNVEVDHDREGLLSDADISRIKASLKTPEEIQEYNKWIRVYQLVDYTLKDAHIHALEAENVLDTALRLLQIFQLQARVEGIMLWSLPNIVTQKQYEDMRASQREYLLSELSSLGQVLEEQAYELATEEQREASEYDSGLLLEEQPELWEQAIQDIISLIQEGKLQPVNVDGPALKRKLKPLKRRQEALRAKESEHRREDILANEATWHLLIEKERQTIRSAYEAGREGQEASQTGLLGELEQLRDGTLPKKQAEALLKYTLFSGEELYNSSLSCWRRWVDEYKPGLESSVRPAGMPTGSKVAIIQDPDPSDLDERGYYKDRAVKELAELSGYQFMSKHKEFCVPEMLQAAHQKAVMHIKVFLAIQAVVEAVSELIGVQLGEDLPRWREHLERVVGQYNCLANPPGTMFQHHQRSLGQPDLPALKIGKLKATTKSIRYYRERMALALGDKWWSEAIKSLTFEADEAGSLAEATIKDFEAVREGWNDEK